MFSKMKRDVIISLLLICTTLSESSGVHDVFCPIVGGQDEEVPLASNPTASNVQLSMREAGFGEVKACDLEGLT